MRTSIDVLSRSAHGPGRLLAVCALAIVFALTSCGSDNDPEVASEVQEDTEADTDGSTADAEDSETSDEDAEGDDEPDEADADGDTADNEESPADEEPVDPASVAAAPSAGCSTSTAAPNPEQMQPLQVGDTARAYFISIPTTSDSTPLPLIIDFHGYSEGAKIHTLMTDLRSFGLAEGFVTVTPQGSGPVPLWNFTAGSEDLALVGALLDEVADNTCIDTNRVFAAGLSNGAFLTSAIACTYSERFAAVATVAGIVDIEDCDPARPVPVVAFHGTADTYVSFEGGFGESIADLPSADGTSTIGETTGAGVDPDAVDQAEDEPVADAPVQPEESDLASLLSDIPRHSEVAETEASESTVTTNAQLTEVLVTSDDEPTITEIAQRWADRNGCDAEPAESEVARTEDDGPINKLSWTDCEDHADVELYIIAGGGHSWPGSEFSATLEGIVGLTTFGIDANEVMWEFFQNHPLT